MNFVIAVNWKDRWFLPACVSSIRRYYPNASITLLKDTFRGLVQTSRLERYFNVSSYPIKRAFGGGGWIKLLPAIRGVPNTFKYPLMILDADIVLQGAVYEEVAAVPGAVVVSPDPFVQRPLNEQYISKTYLKAERLEACGINLEQLIKFPWFNSGHLFIREPYLEFEFIKKWVDWDSTPIRKHDPDLYPLTDQSLLNHYLLLDERIKVGALYFANWAGDIAGSEASALKSTYKCSRARLLHYAGLSRIPYWKMSNWQVFEMENRAAERILRSSGSLRLSHMFQSCIAKVPLPANTKWRSMAKRIVPGI